MATGNDIEMMVVPEDMFATPGRSAPKPVEEEQKSGKKRRSKGGEGDGASAKAAARKASKTAGDEKEKKCRRCKKQKKGSEFYQQQAVCQECSNGLRTLQNVAKRTGETEWLKNLDETQVDALMVAYNKDKAAALKDRAKFQFNLALYKETTVHQQGVRKERRRRMMTEEAYYKFAKSVKGGSLSTSQAERKWQEYKEDPSTVTEGEGDAMKMSIPVSIDLIDYDDVGESREVERQARLNAKMSQKELDAKVNNMVLAGGQKLDTSMAQAAVVSDETDVVLNDLSKLQSKAKQNQKAPPKTRESKDGEETDGEQSGNETAGEEGEAKGKDGGRSKWFDAVSQRAKASRQFDSTMSKQRARMEAQLQAMRQVMDAARASPSAGSCYAEMTILDNRSTALNLVKSSDASGFTGYVTKLREKAAKSKAEDAVSQKSGTDLKLAPFGVESVYVTHFLLDMVPSGARSKNCFGDVIIYCYLTTGWFLFSIYIYVYLYIVVSIFCYRMCCFLGSAQVATSFMLYAYAHQSAAPTRHRKRDESDAEVGRALPQLRELVDPQPSLGAEDQVERGDVRRRVGGLPEGNQADHSALG